jgi:hypothetical protein
MHMKLNPAATLIKVYCAITLSIALAFAQEISVNSRCCGPVTLQIDPDGQVKGRYLKQGGTMQGSIDADGVLTGIWTQPRSDYPCMTAYNGREAWGHFAIYDIGGPKMNGYWGYCDTKPSRPFGFSSQ